MIKWIEGLASEEDVVVSSRIRLARNLQEYRFPQKMNISESESLTQKILAVMKEFSTDDKYEFIAIGNLAPLERLAYIEKHLISPGLIQKPGYSSFLLRDDENITIMINEEDHLRIQVLLPGLNFSQGWKTANEIDDYLESILNFAFSEEFGYLTACPTNVGTGLRASVMLHLPSLTITGYVKSLINGLNQIGLAVRGIYGEGTEAIGDLYQISNQLSLGEGEGQIIKKLENVIHQVMAKERNMRNNLFIKRRNEIEDKIFRSMGLLKYSRNMTSKEAMKLLSDVRLGVEMGIINDIGLKETIKLMMKIQPASIQEEDTNELTQQERNISRADYIRKMI